MRFANPEYLYLLILVPLLVAVYIYSSYRRRRQLKEYGDEELLKELMPDVSAYRPGVKFWLTTTAVAFLAVALARPQFGSKKESVTRQGIETVIALDISNSMLAEDIAPNRLEKSKKIISKLIDKFENDKIGLIVFAGDAFVQLPITNDFISAKMFMETISPSLISRQGTDIGAAINLAMKSFTPEKEVGKAVIVITDGENHEGGAEEAALKASENGHKVFILGIGTAKGGRIPTGGGNFLRDRDGQVVVTKLNEEMAMNIAKAGNGLYLQVDNTNDAQKILSDQLDKMNKEEMTTEMYTGYEELFLYPITLAIILLFMDLIIVAVADSRNRKEK
jgi:Ca-activated chloride channel family protein